MNSQSQAPNKLLPVASRLAAITLLAAVVFACYAMVISPWSDVVSGYDDRLEQTAELLHRYRQVGSRRGPLIDRLAEVKKREPAAGFLQGNSAALIAANLQNRLKQVVQANGATLNSVEILTKPTDTVFQKVGIRVRLLGDVPSVQRIFYALESAPSYLVIENLDLHSNAPRRVRRAARSRTLKRQLVASFDLAGYMWSKSP